MYSKSTAIGLSRNLNEPFENPSAKINFSIRLLKEGDLEYIMENGAMEKIDPRIVAHRRGLVEEEIPRCYVAVSPDGNPCFLQWLISAEHNDAIRGYFRQSFPRLQKGEALLESAYMRRDYRGLGLMAAAVARIAPKAKEVGAKRVITFADIRNIASLKGLTRGGFKPYLLKKDRWFLFRRHVSFHELPDDVLAQYHRIVEERPILRPILTAEK